LIGLCFWYCVWILKTNQTFENQWQFSLWNVSKNGTKLFCHILAKTREDRSLIFKFTTSKFLVTLLFDHLSMRNLLLVLKGLEWYRIHSSCCPQDSVSWSLYYKCISFCISNLYVMYSVYSLHLIMIFILHRNLAAMYRYCNLTTVHV
jgi:hypothetical protein